MEQKGLPSVQSPLSTHGVCLKHTSCPVLWAGLHGAPGWSLEGPGLRAPLGARRDATWLLAEHVVKALWPV